ncbi:hypothetical protein CAG72_01465, partial [Photobacterium halotolerans]|nr:hypothetical protein [Photobacterium halotolerans]
DIHGAANPFDPLLSSFNDVHIDYFSQYLEPAAEKIDMLWISWAEKTVDQSKQAGENNKKGSQ